MSSIGLIFRETLAIESLPSEWIPKPLGPRFAVTQAINECLAQAQSPLSLLLRIEEEDESEDPRTISVSAVWGTNEMALIKLLCERLDARFYDAESGEFVEL